MTLKTEKAIRKPTIHGPRGGTWISWIGSPAQFQAIGAETDGMYCLSRAESFSGGVAPPHTHHFEEGSFSAGAGTFINLPKGSLHWFQNQTATIVRALIFVAPAGFEQMFIETGRQVGSWSDPLSTPDPDEKRRILEVSPRYGVEIRLPD